MSVAQAIEDFRADPRFAPNIVEWRTLPAVPARTVNFPAELNPALTEALRSRGIASLYTHQAAAFESVANGKHTAVVTGTASGKTLCYNLPVLNSI
ncbi:MAG: DEAD/DEAH box helicase, partial [Nitrolancea sp.]